MDVVLMMIEIIIVWYVFNDETWIIGTKRMKYKSEP